MFTHAFLENLEFSQTSPDLYKKSLPEKGVHLLVSIYGDLWVEYDGEGVSGAKQSVGVGNLSEDKLIQLVSIFKI
jgi:hypothetical protein